MHRKAQVILRLIKELYWLHKWMQILFSFASANLFFLNTWDGNDALFANSLDSDFSLIETLLMTQHSGAGLCLEIIMCLNRKLLPGDIDKMATEQLDLP